MRKSFVHFTLFLFSVILFFFLLNTFSTNEQIQVKRKDHIRSSSSPKSGMHQKIARWQYFKNLLKDPATGEIPKMIRQKELAFAKKINEERNLFKKTDVMDLGWKEAGPKDVGGRTRALAVDVKNSNTILAGGITGGMWKSTDNGTSWEMKSTTSQMLSVTTIAQDPRDGHTNNWYYGTGEFFWGNSATDRGGTTIFSGDGIYKSTDNGETWNILPVTDGTDPTRWSRSFDFVLKIMVSPATGSIFVATFGDGIFKSSDAGATFNRIFGGDYNHMFSDFDIAPDGSVIAVVSSTWNDITPENSPGVYRSTNDGVNWTNITPAVFPDQHYRSIIEIAPSNPNIVYILAYTWTLKNNKYDDVRFIKINLSSGAAEDRSDNLPIFPFFGDEMWFDTQNNYNMTMAIKPDDENFVLIGATNLYRSTNGFSTKPTNQKLDWIGGYHPDNFNYPDLHCDIHSYAFDPANPNKMWWGHDGGLSYTSDIRTNSYDTFFPWDNKNNGYNVTQFYTIAIPDKAGDNRIMGGTQDNGTPSFSFDGNTTSMSLDVSSGDGAYTYFGENYPYVSTQNGLVLRISYDPSGNPIRSYPNYSNITPVGATDMLFINPFAIDPNDEDIMMYSAGRVLWRNNKLNSLPDNPDFQNGLSEGWTKLTGLETPAGFTISSLAFTRNNPQHRLYFAASDQNESAGPPKIYKLDNANTATSEAADISISGAANGAYVHNIAINPDDGNELIVVFSNYNISGIYHSTNGGQSFTAIDGNLDGDQNNPGPSIRAATILPMNGANLYLVATSIGVYSTSQPNGSQTQWSQEGANSIGNVVVEYITSRRSDARIVAGTHGRGAFVGQGTSAGSPNPIASVQTLTLQTRPGENGSAQFELSNDGDAALNFNITATGNFGNALPKIAKELNYMNPPDQKDKATIENVRKKRFKNVKSAIIGAANENGLNKYPNSIEGNDVWVLDDGNNASDDFFGYSDASPLYWYSVFYANGFEFELDAFQFYMRTEQSAYNRVEAAIYDQFGNLLSYGDLTLDPSPEGAWFTIPLSSPLNFNDGSSFAIELSSAIGIYYPAGVDLNAQVKNQCYYFNWSTYQYENLNTISGFENGAFLIRAVGTIGGGAENQEPVAVINISKTEAEINEVISFDASQSYDNDGTIVQYLWSFGDGTTSNQKTVNHSYSEANTYNYSLTVTDDKGAAGSASGQILIGGNTNNYITIEPSNGTVQPGGSTTIRVTLNAESIPEGTYTGQLNISTNGGNITIPIDFLVDVEKLSDLPAEYFLNQNYPNPFNPTTTIEFSIARTSMVKLKVYDIIGKEVLTLINENKRPGSYKFYFNADGLSSGVYIYRLETNEFIDSKKLIILK
jgi:hypothetical protein